MGARVGEGGSDREESGLVTGRGDGKEQNVMGLEQKDRAAEQEAVRKASQRAHLMPPTHLEKLGQLNIGKLSPIIPVIHVTSARSPYLFRSLSSKQRPLVKKLQESLPASAVCTQSLNEQVLQCIGSTAPGEICGDRFHAARISYSEVLPSFPASLEQARIRI